MPDTYSFPLNPPRDPQAYKINLNKGLTPYYLGGVFFSFAPLIPAFFFFILNRVYDGKIIFSIFLFSSIGIMLLKNGHSKFLQRKNSFINGTIVTAKVIRHGRAFSFWKSSRDYTIDLKYVIDNGASKIMTITSSSDDLHAELPVSKELTGFYDSSTKNVFFPAEIGIKFTII